MEADSLLTLLTKNKGKAAAIAKGVRKPSSRLRGGVQPFTYNEMQLSEGRNLDIVTQSQCLEAFTPLQEDIKAMTAAGYWSELLCSLTAEGEKDEALFNLALAGFHVLSLSTTPLAIRALEIKLLSVLGYQPCLDRCVSCGKELCEERQLFFSGRLGGVVCSSCGAGQNARLYSAFSREALNIWQQLQKMDLGKTQRLKVSPRGLSILEKVSSEYLLEYLEHPLKAWPILKEMMQD